jgi:predicted nucleic acid-binding protein
LYLVDTNILSATAPAKATRAADLVTWMDEHSADLYLSAVSIAEIVAGSAGLRRRGAMRRAGDLEAWLEALLHLYSDRVLPFDVAVARIAGGLAERVQSMGHAPGFADVAIAATAQHRGLTILTRNIRHFEPLGVPFFDPWNTLPPTRSDFE